MEEDQYSFDEDEKSSRKKLWGLPGFFTARLRIADRYYRGHGKIPFIIQAGSRVLSIILLGGALGIVAAYYQKVGLTYAVNNHSEAPTYLNMARVAIGVVSILSDGQKRMLTVEAGFNCDDTRSRLLLHFMVLNNARETSLEEDSEDNLPFLGL
jgi:hypothetical protein